MWGLFVLTFALIQAPSVVHAQELPTYAEVKADKLNVRDKGSQDAAQVGQLNKGELVPVTKMNDGWVELGWNGKAYVVAEGINMPAGKLNKKPKYEDMREAFIARAREIDKTIQWLEVPRASGITVRYHWREYRDRDALIKRAMELARLYSVMTTGETGIEVQIVSGNEPWAKAFY
jgi:hypothetical protein